MPGKSGGTVAGCGPRRFEAAQNGVKAGAEAFVAVVDPHVLAERDQGGEAVGWQGSDEGVQLGSGRGVAHALFVDAAAALHREPEGVAVNQ